MSEARRVWKVIYYDNAGVERVVSAVIWRWLANCCVPRRALRWTWL